jgi:hypothetical protein
MADLRLRPLERCVQRNLGSGLTEFEVARRFRRSPDWVLRVEDWAKLARPRPQRGAESPLRAVERRVLRWRAEGASHGEIGARFHRGESFIAQIERLARYKLRQDSERS